jgi:Tfp pilus assembly protein PilE
MSQRGSTLIEVMIAAALIAMISFVAAKVIVDQKKIHRQLSLLDSKRELVEEIESELSSYRQCSEMLKESLKSESSLPNQYDQVVPEKYFDERFFHPALRIKQAKITYALAANADSQQQGKLKTYHGTLELLAETRLASTSEILDYKAIRIPLVILDKSGVGSWNEVICSNPDTQTSAIVSEACSYYGGTLVDGIHCDFNRYMRKHVAVPDAAIPVIPVTDTSVVDGKPHVQRISLPDLMCYLDTLATIIPDVALPNRDPNFDSIKKDRTTLFCKRPGKVFQSNTVPNMNLILKTMSSDVRSYFTEVQNGP